MRLEFLLRDLPYLQSIKYGIIGQVNINRNATTRQPLLTLDIRILVIVHSQYIEELQLEHLFGRIILIIKPKPLNNQRHVL